MPWKIVERRIGRAGGEKDRLIRQRSWDRLYGEDRWAVGYVVHGEFVPQDVALQTIYYQSYEEHFQAHPSDLEELLRTAKVLRNPHAQATTSVDLQVPAILRYLDQHGLRLAGTEVVDIGSWEGQSSHALSVRLSPLTIAVSAASGRSKMTLEKFWQSQKCLATWEE